MVQYRDYEFYQLRGHITELLLSSLLGCRWLGISDINKDRQQRLRDEVLDMMRSKNNYRYID